ncbi:MAG: hypothetical protein LBB95_00240 [Mycoplasmataceae bacterium]|jgi:hypothetical protein|nr:hypothetical protein [Mycoplasmataceae bacterium]
MIDKNKKVGKIESVNFDDLPKTIDYVNTKPKNNDGRKIALVLSILTFCVGVGICFFYLINFLVH